MNLQIAFHKVSFALTIPLLVSQAGTVASAQAQPAAIGVFQAHTDVGDNPRPGSASFDADAGTYRITGGGSNMWGPADAFHLVWKRANGNFAITADVRFVGKGIEDHRKAVLVVRQSLDANAAYADVALHGDGLAALQFRPVPGAQTSEVRSSVHGPVRMRIERRGAQFLMSVGEPNKPLVSAAPTTVSLDGPVYVGLRACSHDARLPDTATI